MQLPLNIDTELQVLKLLDSPTFQLPITECLTASELLPINPSPTPHNGIPRALYFPAPDDYLPEGRPACSNCSPPILVILVRLIGWNRLSIKHLRTQQFARRRMMSYHIQIPIFFLFFSFSLFKLSNSFSKKWSISNAIIRIFIRQKYKIEIYKMRKFAFLIHT